MKVLHVIPSIDPATGGPAEGLRQLCRAYGASGIDVDVASLDRIQTIIHLKFPADVIALGPAVGVYGYSLRAASWFKDNVSRYDVVFMNGIWQYAALAAYRALRNAKVPYAIFTHGMLDPYFKKSHPIKHFKKTLYWRFVLEKMLNQATVVLFTSEQERVSARESFCNYAVKEKVMPYGTFGPECDLELSAEKFITKWPGLQNQKIVLQLGRIHPKKGIDLLIAGFAATLANDPAWRLVIAGPDECGLEGKLKRLASSLNIEQKIIWTGLLSGEMKWGAYAVADVFVLPSHQENFGVVIAEALACSLPVIVSSRVNIWREIISYRAGLVCDDSIEGVQMSLSRWQSFERDEVSGYQTRSRRCFDELFNYATIADGTLSMLNEIASSNKLTASGERETAAVP